MSDRCEACVFRTEIYQPFRCNFAWLMYPETRKAELPEECTHFIEGERLENPAAAKEFMLQQSAGGKKNKKASKAKKRYRLHCDWGRARALYDQGYSDGKVAAAIGGTRSAVQNWRRRNKLPSNHSLMMQKAAEMKQEEKK